jgi:hypothetical protein
LHITWDGAELEDPQILEITLASRGRRDIASEDFDQPLELKVGATIKAILRTAAGPNESTFRAVSFKDDILSVGPALITRRQLIKFTALAVGREPELSSAAAALRDVRVEVTSMGSSQRRWTRPTKIAVAVAIAFGATGLILVGLLIGDRSAQRDNAPSAGHSPRPTVSVKPSKPSKPLASNALLMAEADLDAGSEAAQLEGISALATIMKTSPRSQPAAIKALTGFIRSKSPTGLIYQPVTAIVQAALNDLRTRNPANDAGVVVILNNANLTNADLSNINLSNASLVSANLSDDNLANANLYHADLSYAFIGGANLDGTELAGADLAGASFYHTIMCHGSAPTQSRRGYNCNAK